MPGRRALSVQEFEKGRGPVGFSPIGQACDLPVELDEGPREGSLVKFRGGRSARCPMLTRHGCPGSGTWLSLLPVPDSCRVLRAGGSQPYPGPRGVGAAPGDMMIDWLSPPAGMWPLSLVRPARLARWEGRQGLTADRRELAAVVHIGTTPRGPAGPRRCFRPADRDTARAAPGIPGCDRSGSSTRAADPRPAASAGAGSRSCRSWRAACGRGRRRCRPGRPDTPRRRPRPVDAQPACDGHRDILKLCRGTADRADDQVGAADPASRQALAVHPGNECLDVLAADCADRLAADRGVDVSAQHRPVGGNAGLRAQVLVQPRLGGVAEQHPSRPGATKTWARLSCSTFSAKSSASRRSSPKDCSRCRLDRPPVVRYRTTHGCGQPSQSPHSQRLMILATIAIPPGSGAIPPRAARGTAGTGRPGSLAGPIAASSRRRSSSARPARQPAPPPTGAGSSRPREPRAGQAGAGPIHARLRPSGQVRSGVQHRSRRAPTASGFQRFGGGWGSRAATGGSALLRLGSWPARGPEQDGLACRPGTRAIQRRLRLERQVRA